MCALGRVLSGGPQEGALPARSGVEWWDPFGDAVEVLWVAQLSGQNGAPKMDISFAADDSLSPAEKERKTD